MKDATLGGPLGPNRLSQKGRSTGTVKYHIMMAIAGPTNTNGCSLSVQCVGRPSTMRLKTQYSRATPPRAHTMATVMITQRGAALSRRNINPWYKTKNDSSGMITARKMRPSQAKNLANGFNSTLFAPLSCAMAPPSRCSKPHDYPIQTSRLSNPDLTIIQSRPHNYLI